MNEIESIFKAGELCLTYKRKHRDGARVTQDTHLLQTIREAIGDDMEVREIGVIIGLSRANKIRTVFRLASGGAAGCIFDPKLIFSRLLLDHCAAFVMAHNHPSGVATPSLADRHITTDLVKAGKVLDLRCLDHIIVTHDDHKSLSDICI